MPIEPFSIEQLNKESERRRAIELSYNDPRKAKYFLQDKIIDEEDYNEIMRHHAFNSESIIEADAALRQGFISYEEYVNINRKRYLKSNTGKTLLQGFLEGFLDYDESMEKFKAFEEIFERDQIEYQEYEDSEYYTKKYLDRIVLKPGKDLRKAAISLYNKLGSRSSLDAFTQGHDLEIVTRFMRRIGFILPSKADNTQFMSWEEDEYYYTIKQFINEFYDFIKNEHPDILKEATISYRKKKARELRKQRREMQDIMKIIGAKCWKEVEFRYTPFGPTYAIKRDNGQV
jgi:hypothetical protein